MFTLHSLLHSLASIIISILNWKNSDFYLLSSELQNYIHQLLIAMHPRHLNSTYLKINSLSFLLFLLYFPFSVQFPPSTQHASLKTKSSLIPPSPSCSTTNLSVTTSTSLSDQPTFSFPFITPTPSFPTIAPWTIAFKQISTWPLWSAFPEPIIYTATRPFKNRSQIMSLTGMKFINSP